MARTSQSHTSPLKRPGSAHMPASTHTDTLGSLDLLADTSSQLPSQQHTDGFTQVTPPPASYQPSSYQPSSSQELLPRAGRGAVL
mmetsp:Transcript_20679/g.46253  ORF Transcript_20679/g.46253 Transcript_20679/m.46253 type:complete len:85 (-) Transcript_20679:1288-1542(-)